MLSHVRRNAVAYVALFVALGGSATAATIAANSVGNKQLKRDAVTSSKVKNRSLLAVDFRSGQLPRGAQGPKGDTGPQGPAGPAGAAAPSTCPASTVAASGACIEVNIRAAQGFADASNTCGAAGRRLATTSELLYARNVAGIDLVTAEVSSDLLDFTSNGTPVNYVTVTEAGGLQTAPLATASPFRCVTDA